MSHVSVIGLGAIGSVVAPLVARLPGISSVNLIDPDHYGESNRYSQAIDGNDVGCSKVAVKGGQIAAISPQIAIHAFAEKVENVPLGYFRESILVCCVDNRRARQAVNRIAWRCGRPWINAAVDAPSLVRINVYIPDAAAPCLECGWDERSYDLLEQEYPCNIDGSIPATAAPAELGALAASLQVAELRKLFSTNFRGQALAGAQLMLDTDTHERHLVHFGRAGQCRFDHQTWHIETLDLVPQEHSLADLFDLVKAGRGEGIGLEGHIFATHIDCIDCGKRSSVRLHLYGRLTVEARTCSCGGQMLASGFFSFERIQQAELSKSKLCLRLAAVGIQSGDVLSLNSSTGIARHFQIGEIPVDA